MAQKGKMPVDEAKKVHRSGCMQSWEYRSCHSEALHARRGADILQLADQEPEVEGGSLNQHPFSKLPLPANCGHGAGLPSPAFARTPAPASPHVGAAVAPLGRPGSGGDCRRSASAHPGFASTSGARRSVCSHSTVAHSPARPSSSRSSCSPDGHHFPKLRFRLLTGHTI